MIDVPILRIELEGVRSSVVTMLQDRNDELNKMIAQEIDATLKLEWVQEKISYVVKEMIGKAIDKVSNNYQLQDAIASLVSNAVTEMVQKQNQ